MKKKYIAPSVEIINVQATNVMAQSFVFYNEISVDSSYMLGRDKIDGSNIWGEW